MFSFAKGTKRKNKRPTKCDQSKQLSRNGRPVVADVVGSLSKPRRRRQRERHKTKGLRKTKAVQVRYKSLSISLPSPAKQEREMTKFCVV